MSEPERPSVVVSPDGARPMNPVTTGTIPFARRAPSVRRARGSVFFRSHVAAPCFSSVTRNVRASTARAGTPDGREGRGDERRREALAEGGDEVGDARRPLAQERDPGEGGVELGERRRRRRRRSAPVAAAMPAAAASWRARSSATALPGPAEVAPLGLVRGGQEEVGDPSHRRGDGDEPAAARGGGEDPGRADDPLGVAERGPPELVDDEGLSLIFGEEPFLQLVERRPERLPAPRPDVAEDVADAGLPHAERGADLASREAREAPGEPDGRDLGLVGARVREPRLRHAEPRGDGRPHPREVDGAAHRPFPGRRAGEEAQPDLPGELRASDDDPGDGPLAERPDSARVRHEAAESLPGARPGRREAAEGGVDGEPAGALGQAGRRRGARPAPVEGGPREPGPHRGESATLRAASRKELSGSTRSDRNRPSKSGPPRPCRRLKACA